jgi:hypothetical protein
MKKILTHTGLAILLFVFGFVSSKGFTELSISLLDLNGINIAVTTIKSQFNESLLFSIALGIIPFILLTVNKIFGSLSGLKNDYLLPIGLIILTGTITWILRIFVLNNKIERMNSFDLGENIQQTLSFDTLNFSIYLLSGFIIGGIVSIPISKRLPTKK